jgi:choline transporter-like protein 2/4/5
VLRVATVYIIGNFVLPLERHFLSLTSFFLLQIAIKGKGFCSSAQTAAKLLFGNVLRVAAVNVIGDFVLFLGKMAVSLACAVLAFLMLDGERYKTGQDKISSPLAPVLV